MFKINVEDITWPKSANNVIYYRMLQKCFFWRLGYLFGYRKPLITDV